MHIDWFLIDLLLLMLQVVLRLERYVDWVHHLALLDACETLAAVQLLQAANEGREVLHGHLLEVDSVDLCNSLFLLLLLVGRVIG